MGLIAKQRFYSVKMRQEQRSLLQVLEPLFGIST